MKKISMVFVFCTVFFAACGSSPAPRTPQVLSMKERTYNVGDLIGTYIWNDSEKVLELLRSGKYDSLDRQHSWSYDYTSGNTRYYSTSWRGPILHLAARDGKLDIVQELIQRGADINLRSNTGNTALMAAARNGHTNIVTYLVERGANVNLRAEDGATAASLAYDNGLIDIYDYLKANGARDFEPRQTAQQPAAPAPSSTTNVYVQPSAPAQSSASSEPSRNTGREVADSINRAFESPLEIGRYRVSGRAEEISFAGIARAGNVSYKDAAGTTHRGTYSIDSDRLTINVMGKSYFYTINSKTSFSGHGENWVRTGY